MANGSVSSGLQPGRALRPRVWKAHDASNEGSAQMQLSFAQLPDALAQDLIQHFDLETLAQLSRVNRVWRYAALGDLRVRYDCAKPQAHQSDCAWWRRDCNAQVWHERICRAIAQNQPNLLAMLLSMGKAHDAVMYGVLTGVTPYRPTEPSFLIRAAQVPTQRCAQVLLDTVAHCALGVCMRNWRASHYAHAAHSIKLWRTLRIAEQVEGAVLERISDAEQPMPLAHDSFPAGALACGDYSALVRWVEQKRGLTKDASELQAPFLSHIERAIDRMPRTESLQAKWAMQKLTAFYYDALPAHDAWPRSVCALFEQHPKLHASTGLKAYLPLEHDTEAALEQVWRTYAVPCCTSKAQAITLIDALFEPFLQVQSVARIAFLAELFARLDVCASDTAAGYTQSFAQRAYAMGRFNFVLCITRRTQRLPGLLTHDKNVLHCLMAEIRTLYYTYAKRFEQGICEIIDTLLSPDILSVFAASTHLLLQRDSAQQTALQVILHLPAQMRYGIELFAPLVVLRRLLDYIPADILAQSLRQPSGSIDPDCAAIIHDMLQSSWLKQPAYKQVAQFLVAQTLPSERYQDRLTRQFWQTITP